MAVKRVYGYVDGVEIVLQNVQGEMWQASIPFKQDCEYIVELYTEDDAGNISYLTRALFTYDPKSLILKIAPILYECNLLLEPYKTDIISSRKEQLDTWIA